MARPQTLFRTLVAMILTFLPARRPFAHTNPSVNGEGQGVVLTNLTPPTYPILARQAHIAGEVVLEIRLEREGTMPTVEAVSGHPLLQQVALDSARHSSFACRNCGEGVTVRRIVYLFQLLPMKSCAKTPSAPNERNDDESYPRVIWSNSYVNLVDEPIQNCDVEIFAAKKVRAARCFYMWKCGVSVLITHDKSNE